MGGYGAIVDDPSTARHLALHELYRFLGAEKRAGEVGADDCAPLFVREVFKRHWWSAQACIVEEEIQPPERLSRLREKSADRPRVSDVRLNTEHSRSHFRSLGSRGLQRLLMTAGHNDGVPVLRKTKGNSPPDSSAAARDDGHLGHRIHAHPLQDFLAARVPCCVIA